MMNQPSGNAKKRLLLVGVGIVVVIAIMLAALIGSGTKETPNQFGTVTLNYSVATSDGISVKVDNNSVEATGEKPEIQVAPGSHTLEINKPNYETFSANIDIRAGETVLVNVNLKAKKNPTITDIRQVTLPAHQAGVKLVKAEYFYDQTWAIITVTTPTETDTIIVATYSAEKGTWETVTGPSSILSYVDSEGLPVAIQAYLRQNNRLDLGE